MIRFWPRIWSGFCSVSFIRSLSRNGDSAVGYMGLVALHDELRTFKRDWVEVTETSTRRVQDIIYSVSEFRKVFPKFKQRVNVRRMLGSTRYDFSSTSSLQTYEDAYFVSQRNKWNSTPFIFMHRLRTNSVWAGICSTSLRIGVIKGAIVWKKILMIFF